MHRYITTDFINGKDHEIEIRGKHEVLAILALYLRGGFQRQHTPGDGLLCGLYALEIGLRPIFQLRKMAPPTFNDLLSLHQGEDFDNAMREYANFPMTPNTEKEIVEHFFAKENLDVNALMVILELLRRETGISVTLGIITPDHDYENVYLAQYHAYSNESVKGDDVVWVFNDLRGSQDGGTVSHWSGIAPPSDLAVEHFRQILDHHNLSWPKHLPGSQDGGTVNHGSRIAPPSGRAAEDIGQFLDYPSLSQPNYLTGIQRQSSSSTSPDPHWLDDVSGSETSLSSGASQDLASDHSDDEMEDVTYTGENVIRKASTGKRRRSTVSDLHHRPGKRKRQELVHEEPPLIYRHQMLGTRNAENARRRLARRAYRRYMNNQTMDLAINRLWDPSTTVPNFSHHAPATRIPDIRSVFDTSLDEGYESNHDMDMGDLIMPLREFRNVTNAPPASTDLPYDEITDITLEELVIYFPNHVRRWPGLALLHRQYGWDFMFAKTCRLVNKARGSHTWPLVDRHADPYSWLRCAQDAIQELLGPEYNIYEHDEKWRQYITEEYLKEYLFEKPKAFVPEDTYVVSLQECCSYVEDHLFPGRPFTARARNALDPDIQCQDPPEPSEVHPLVERLFSSYEESDNEEEDDQQKIGFLDDYTGQGVKGWGDEDMGQSPYNDTEDSGDGYLDQESTNDTSQFEDEYLDDDTEDGAYPAPKVTPKPNARGSEKGNPRNTNPYRVSKPPRRDNHQSKPQYSEYAPRGDDQSSTNQPRRMTRSASRAAQGGNRPDTWNQQRDDSRPNTRSQQQGHERNLPPKSPKLPRREMIKRWRELGGIENPEAVELVRRNMSKKRGHEDTNSRGRGNSARGRGDSSRGRGDSSRGRGDSSRGRGDSARGRGDSSRGRGGEARGRGGPPRGRRSSTRGEGGPSRGGTASNPRSRGDSRGRARGGRGSRGRGRGRGGRGRGE